MMSKFSVSNVTIAFVIMLGLGIGLNAQETPSSPGREKASGRTWSDSETSVAVTRDPVNQASWPLHSLTDLARDQKDLWITPTKFRFSDTTWFVPLSGLTAGLFVTDSDVAHSLSQNPATLSHYNTASNAGLAMMVGGAGGMWLMSYFNHNQHWRETGLLAGEATIQSLAMTETLKYSFRRERPDQGNGSGDFFQAGGGSFPSEHSAAAWSIAGVLAHEYPGPLMKILAYGGASLVSYSRVRAEKHFPSDVAIGAFLGTLAAREIYKKHHDVELGGDEWGPASNIFYDEGHARPGFVGSPYVPLDSWVYPALDRLAARGLIESNFAGMRPWTRLACAQMVTEAQSSVEGTEGIAVDLIQKLEDEFQPELGGGAERGQTTARVESAYFRTENISGKPLTDGYYFAQTQINDFGRPFAEGWNTVTGFSTYATSGPWVGYVRGELQTAPENPALPLAARQFVASFDGLPGLPSASPAPAVQQFRLLDAYVGLTMSNWQVSFGRQSLMWGPGDGGAMLASTNAVPIDMFRVNRVTPLGIPLVSRFFGPVRLELFFGQLSGHRFVGTTNTPTGGFSVIGSFDQTLSKQPYIHGERFTFKPTRNFEFGFSLTTLMGGPGIPLTFGTLKHTLFAFRNAPAGTLKDPGDRRSGMDWSYRLPKLRDWVTFYGDAFADDQPSPIAYWDRSAIRAGLYLSHFPELSKLDLRVEGVYTDLTAGGAIGHGYFYANNRFKSGYTNDGNLMGSWIGRDGQGAQVWSNYWFSAKNRLQFSFRHQKVSQQFTPGGGTLTDASVREYYWFPRGIGISASVQGERWLFPVIAPSAKRNVSTSIEVLFQPRTILRRASK